MIYLSIALVLSVFLNFLLFQFWKGDAKMVAHLAAENLHQQRLLKNQGIVLPGEVGKK